MWKVFRQKVWQFIRKLLVLTQMGQDIRIQLDEAVMLYLTNLVSVFKGRTDGECHECGVPRRLHREDRLRVGLEETNETLAGLEQKKLFYIS